MGCDISPCVRQYQRSVSIHAPTWGATPTPCAGLNRLPRFNPRTHVGCDRMVNAPFSTSFVSIHAPTWGATSLRTLAFGFAGFQSTHPRGVRPSPARSCFGCLVFQSTHPRGVRHNPLANRILPDSFNPRTHVGCDYGGYRMFPATYRFNPRTHVGCDTHIQQISEYHITKVH